MPVPTEKIIEYLRTTAGRPLKAKELAKGLGVANRDYREFRERLIELEREGRLYRARSQRYAVPERINLLVGRLQTIRGGAGFVIPEDGGKDLYVPAHGMDSAVDGDKVVARVEHQRRGKRREGSIVKVLERARERVVGVYNPARNFGFVVPEDRRLTRDIFIPPGHEGKAGEGDVVVVRITDWGNHHLGPTGEIDHVLGPATKPGVDILTVVYGHGLPIEFPEEVIEEAVALRERGIQEEDLQGRTDLRDLYLITIDPEDARDHDDGLSIEVDEDGTRRVGIHIADISHYVPPGSALDAEAKRRGTSVYLVDRVIPMLPTEISNQLGSLEPGEDRLALSLLLTIDREGEVREHRLVRSIVRSRHRVSYDQAQGVIDETSSIDEETDRTIRELVALSRRLRERRAERGSLDFDLPEARVILNTEGEPTDIQRVLRLESHRLIEDLMLLANETVAAEVVRRQIPMIYRIHEPPDEEKIDQLRDFVATFGHRLGRGGIPSPKEVQRLLDRVSGRPEENLISTIVLRSMKQARYSSENVGHFGLATDDYLHFTSPIRRYPDLMAHRLVIEALIEQRRPLYESDEEELEAIAKLASERERVAVEAERDSIALKKVEFMEERIGESFEGTISGVTAFGLFVLLDEFFIEGLVHVSWMTDDYYIFIEEQFALIGERTRRRFQLGDRVRVEVTGVRRDERAIDFQLV